MISKKLADALASDLLELHDLLERLTSNWTYGMAPDPDDMEALSEFTDWPAAREFVADSKETYYKAVRPDGKDFYSGTVQWAVEPGEIVHHPTSTLPPDEWSSAWDYLSVATVPTDCTGTGWPARLFEVEPVDGHPVTSPSPANLPHKRAATAWRVVREVESHLALGPQGEVLVEFLDALGDLTEGEVKAMVATRNASRTNTWVAWDAARDVAYTTRNAAWIAAWAVSHAVHADIRGAARDAVRALVVADLVGQHNLTREHLDTLTAPARTVPRLAAIIDRALPTTCR